MKGKYQGSIPKNCLKDSIIKRLTFYHLDHIFRIYKIPEKYQDMYGFELNGNIKKYHMEGDVKVIDEIDPTSIGIVPKYKDEKEQWIPWLLAPREHGMSHNPYNYEQHKNEAIKRFKDLLEGFKE